MSSSVRRQLLPHELVFEILSWLPVSSLLRFKCVSKRWSSTIQDPAFVDVHMKRAIGSWVFRTTSDDPYESSAEQIYISRCRGLILEKRKGYRNSGYGTLPPGKFCMCLRQMRMSCAV
ncbi:UNVERIFIED_CONTAM: F-box protein [Sesamum calycinum]|uniref:F-box protein n=1 Tax=Sesamum calycinum TaxID=2727403 RepID=A0AAW2Q690_9LAMI